jgi:hypothetical protein
MIADKNLKPYKTPEPGIFNLRAGALQSREDVLIVAGLARLDEERTSHSVILKWSGGLPWYGAALNWSSAACCAIVEPEPHFCILGIDGESGLLHDNAFVESRVGRTSLYAVAAVGSSTYAVGAGGQFLRSEDSRSWTHLAHSQKARTGLLEAVAAYAQDEIYAVGADGAIDLFTSAIERIDSPTNLVIAGICRGPDDILYACGQKGLVLRGRKHQWAVVEHGVTNEDLWGICSFQGRVFLTSTRFLYELIGDKLETVSFGHDRPRTFCKLTAVGDDALLSVGQRDAFLFEGCEWTRLI